MIDSIGTPVSGAQVAAQLSSYDGIRTPGENASLEEIQGVAKQLEGVFFSLFVKEMRKTMTEDSLFGEGPGADTYEGFFDQMMGEHLGATGGLGIAEMVVRNHMLNQGRVTMDELQTHLAEATDESLAAEAVDKGRENDAVTETSERS